MTDLRSPFDEGKLALIRDFLREHFAAHHRIHSFDFDKAAQRLTLVNQGLVDTLGPPGNTGDADEQGAGLRAHHRRLG
jgi:hypothetical protein